MYMADNWPIKYVCICPDGKFVAVAGRRGLAHYSSATQRWRLFGSQHQVRKAYGSKSSCPLPSACQILITILFLALASFVSSHVGARFRCARRTAVVQLRDYCRLPIRIDARARGE
jgi:hypothetical protein